MTSIRAMSLKDCCDILQTDPSLSLDEIRKAYHLLARKYHPDHNPGNPEFEDRFKEISRAFQTLEKRFRDFKLLNVDVDIAQEPETYDSGFFAKFLENRPRLKQFVEQTVSLLNALETQVFLLDVIQEVAVDSRTAEQGGTIRIRKGKENYLVRIPPGAWNRMTLRISGKGESSLFRKRRGDLVMTLRIASEEATAAMDFYYEFPLSRSQLLEGRIHTLRTTDGMIKFTLPKHASDGQVFTLRGKKGKNISRQTRHVVTVRVQEDASSVEFNEDI
ncbi:MAG: J domain-containing protein [Candidatus Nitrohelix vancouverensis]|uniref:J domain-containing protein n=1 Tax=Candidatus Nitrohelix vancouverensis TaxID=2705534 RepID=A0A7T0C3I8_9BACT|nr:MAG: J domain-containing protein [Candidatus Nitrohelix vancouverensis]